MVDMHSARIYFLSPFFLADLAPSSLGIPVSRYNIGISQKMLNDDDLGFRAPQHGSYMAPISENQKMLKIDYEKNHSNFVSLCF